MKKSIFAAIAAACQFALISPHALADDLVATAEKSGEIKTFFSALKHSGLDKKLKENGPYTVFAPSNAAFKERMPDFESMMKDRKQLAEFVSQHILQEKLLVNEVKPGMVKTIANTELKLKSDNGKITVNDANVTLSDIEADNGVIHIIDSVLKPAQ